MEIIRHLSRPVVVSYVHSNGHTHNIRTPPFNEIQGPKSIILMLDRYSEFNILNTNYKYVLEIIYIGVVVFVYQLILCLNNLS